MLAGDARQRAPLRHDVQPTAGGGRPCSRRWSGILPGSGGGRRIRGQRGEVGLWIGPGLGRSKWASGPMISGRLNGIGVWGRAFPAAAGGGRTHSLKRRASGLLLNGGIPCERLR